MDLIRPITVTSAVLTTHSIPYPAATDIGGEYDARFAAWDSGTTYADGDLVGVYAGLNGPGYADAPATIYESLQGSNTNHSPAGSPAWWQALGEMWPTKINGAGYDVGDRVTPADDTQYQQGLDLIYECIQSTRIGGQNLSDTDYWLIVGAVPHLAPFDGINNYPATWNDEISYTLTPGERVDTIALMNMANVAAVNVTVTVSAVEVYNEDFDLATGTGVAGWYDWFFDPSQSVYDLAVADLAITGLPLDVAAVFTITITGTGTISVGEILLGQGRDIGTTKYNLGLGITDYSRIEEDGFGVRSIVQRPYVKLMAGETWVEAANVTKVYNLLASVRATPVLLIGGDTYSASVQFGMFKSWNMRIGPSHSTLSLEFQGL